MSRLASSPLKRLWRQYCAALVYGTLLLCAAIGQHRGYGGACLAVAVSAAAINGARIGTAVGVAAGWLWDAFAERQTAYHALLLAALCAVVGMLCDRGRLRGLTGTLLAAGTAGMVCTAMQGAVPSLLFWGINVGGALGWTLLFYPVLRRARRWLGKSE